MTTSTDLHNKAMLAAEAAFAARKTGLLSEAMEHFAEAMRLEAQAGLALPPDPASEPSRSVLLRSAATLALHAAQPQEAIRLAAAGLSGAPPAAIQVELGEVLDGAIARTQPWYSKLDATGIAPVHVQHYLSRRGWRRIDAGFVPPTCSVPVIGLVDGSLDVGAAIAKLAQYEGRSPSSVALQVRQPRDVLHLRVGMGRPDMALSHKEIQSLYGAAQNLLRYSVALEMPPGLARKERKQLESTFSKDIGYVSGHGSHIATAVLPGLPAASSQPVAKEGGHEVSVEEEPAERRALLRIFRGLSAVEQAVLRSDVAPLLDSPETGFSFNMCEAMSALLQAFPSGVQFNGDVYPAWTSTPPRPLRASIAGRAQPLVHEAAERLRGVPVLERVTADAWVERLAHPRKSRTHELGLLWERPRGRLSFTATVSPESYARALEAHQEDKQVVVRGQLQKSGRKWLMNDAVVVAAEDASE